MVTLKEYAEAYVPQQTKNIAELDKIPVDVELLNGEGKDRDGEVFNYKYIEVNKQQYRVPNTVIGGIKVIQKKYPHIKFVTVDKEGEGMNTRYQVLPFVEPPKEEEIF